VVEDDWIGAAAKVWIIAGEAMEFAGRFGSGTKILIGRWSSWWFHFETNASRPVRADTGGGKSGQYEEASWPTRERGDVDHGHSCVGGTKGDSVPQYLQNLIYRPLRT